jgi:hypothetical protein
MLLISTVFLPIYGRRFFIRAIIATKTYYLSVIKCFLEFKKCLFGTLNNQKSFKLQTNEEKNVNFFILSTLLNIFMPMASPVVDANLIYK